MKIDLQSGEIWLIDKPYEWTSFDVLRKLKPALIRNTGDKKAKIGHAGTLDPLATGLLIICVGKKTKLIDQIQSGTKEYTGTFFLGASTASYDRETPVDREFSIEGIRPEHCLQLASQFIGEQEQEAPVFSAKLIDGKRAYEHARKGTAVEMKKHRIELFEFELTAIRLPYIDFRVRCSKGTYIRSLAHDFGKRLNSGAYLYDLRRTKSGDYDVEHAQSISQVLERLTGEQQDINLESKRAFLRDNRSEGQ
jgi:tRNA pseudouridine55 synthase